MPSLDETFPIIDAHQHYCSLEIFGVERCTFASNFPVDRLVGSFAVIYSGFRRAAPDLAPADRCKLFHDDAERVYRLGSAPRRGGRA